MNLEIVTEREGKFFHQDGKGRFYYKNHDDYSFNNRTYLRECMNCHDYIYPDQKTKPENFSRLGTVYLHNKCFE